MKKNHLKNKNSKQLTANELRITLIGFLKQKPKKSFSPKQLITVLQLANNKDAILHALHQLAKEGYAFPNFDNTKFSGTPQPAKRTLRKDEQHIGTVDINKNGDGYIQVKDLATDIFVASKNLKGAMKGDTVEVLVWGSSLRRRRWEGEITQVIERATNSFVGTLILYKKKYIVQPAKVFNIQQILIKDHLINGAKEGDNVVVEITKWHEKSNQSPQGRIKIVLGSTGTNDFDMKSILINAGFNIEFPDEVMAEAEKISHTISTEEIKRRKDFRQITTFTIDPIDAKDFDDALSVRHLENGTIEIGVHIADVSHYLHPNTTMDKEAYLRSTSVYLVDRCCPMLPEVLSNELCSLRPNEDKLTFSAVFLFDKNYQIVDRWFGKTIIHSDRRFTYEEAQEIIETKKGDYADELLLLNKIAGTLRKAKFKNGAINFETNELKFTLDIEGNPIAVHLRERKEAHLLVEEFMLLANKEVATFIVNKEKDIAPIPFIYRVHDLPDIDKLADLAAFTAELGFKFDMKKIHISLNKLMEASLKNEHLKEVIPLAVRTMAKAEYNTKNIGHYGLAFDNYTHFTSPIRRYSDVLAHRILEKNLTKTYRTQKSTLDVQCQHISKQERKAMDAERESVKLKQVEFISDKVGQVFEGKISGMSERGFFIELNENYCEGMISFDKFQEAIDIDTSRLKALGRKSKHIYRIGDSMIVKVLSTDKEKRQINFDVG